MRSESDKNTRSAAKKIIPAAAMLALSAVMLSTSTYAWFTMNKQVEMKGLSMTATAGEGMEIALASVDDSNAITGADSRPSDDSEKSWKSSVIVGQYYDDIGKLRPASSADGKAFFDATDASEGGKKASTFKEIDTSAADSKAVTKLNTTLGAIDAEIGSDSDVGYYVDIPVYLRTNKAAGDTNSGKIYCKLMIKNKAAAGSASAANNGELYKSVRVAFVPMSAGTSSENKIFAVNDSYYESGPVISTTAKGTANIVTADAVTDGDQFVTGDGAESGLEIPFASGAESYGHLDFYVRVWIDGESTFCYDATSGQSWNIDLAFSMDKFA